MIKELDWAEDINIDKHITKNHSDDNARNDDPLSSSLLLRSSKSFSSSNQEEFEQEQQVKQTKQNCKKTKSPSGMIFPVTLHKILMESESLGHDNIISWLPSGKAFKIHDRDSFVENVLPRYYPSVDPKNLKWKSFLRQINLYGFERYSKKKFGADKFGAYRHDLFIRDDRALCAQIGRKDGKSKVKPTSVPPTRKKQQSVSNNNKKMGTSLSSIIIATKTSPCTVDSSLGGTTVSPQMSSGTMPSGEETKSSLSGGSSNNTGSGDRLIHVKVSGTNRRALVAATASPQQHSGVSRNPAAQAPAPEPAPRHSTRGHHRRTLTPLSELASCFDDDKDLPAFSGSICLMEEDDDMSINDNMSHKGTGTPVMLNGNDPNNDNSYLSVWPSSTMICMAAPSFVPDKWTDDIGANKSQQGYTDHHYVESTIGSRREQEQQPKIQQQHHQQNQNCFDNSSSFFIGPPSCGAGDSSSGDHTNPNSPSWLLPPSFLVQQQQYQRQEQQQHRGGSCSSFSQQQQQGVLSLLFPSKAASSFSSSGYCDIASVNITSNTSCTSAFTWDTSSAAFSPQLFGEEENHYNSNDEEVNVKLQMAGKLLLEEGDGASSPAAVTKQQEKESLTVYLRSQIDTVLGELEPSPFAPNSYSVNNNNDNMVMVPSFTGY